MVEDCNNYEFHSCKCSDRQFNNSVDDEVLINWNKHLNKIRSLFDHKLLEIKQLQKKIPALEAAIVISHDGDLLDYDITKYFDQD